MATPKEQVWQIALDNQSAQQERHRELVFENIADSSQKNSSLLVKDERVKGGFYKIPLGKVTPVAKGTGSQQKNVLVPLLPYTFTTADNARDKAIPVREGWIYVFKNGFLWREMKVEEKSRLRDVNLTEYQKMDYRQAYGELDVRLVVPYKVDGQQQKIEVCFSEVQWSWDYINSMGGMDPADPRLKSDTPMPQGEQKSGSAAKRKKRMQELKNLSSYNNSFESTPKDSEIASLDCCADTAHRRLHAPSKLGVLFLYDPIGIAQILKEKQLAKVHELGILRTCMQKTDYALAKLVDGIVKSEDNYLLTNEESKKKIDDSLSDTELRRSTRPSPGNPNGTWHIHSREQQDRMVKDYHKELEKKLEEFGSIRQNVDLPRVQETLKEWEDQEKIVESNFEKTGKEFLQFIKDTSQKLSFEDAILDYLNNTSSRYCLGMARMVYFIEYFMSKDEIEYLKQIAEKKNKIGKFLLEMKEIEKHRELIISLESENITNVKEDGFRLDTMTVSALSKKASKCLTRFMEGMAKYWIPLGKPGFDTFIKVMNVYFGTVVNLKLTEIAMRSIFQPVSKVNARTYRQVFDVNTFIQRMKTNYIYIAPKAPVQIQGSAADLAFIKANADATALPFRGLQALVYTLNMVIQLNEFVKLKEVPAKETATLAYAINDVIKSGFELAEAALKYNKSMYQTASAEAKTKIAGEQARRASIKGNAASNSGTQSALKQSKNKIKLFKVAEKEALQQVLKMDKWTNVTGTWINGFTLLGAVLIVGIGAMNLSDAKDGKGIAGALAKATGDLMTLTSFRHFSFVANSARISNTVTALRTAGFARSAIALGAVTSEFGVGIIILVVGVIVSIVGEVLLKESNRPALLKALDYCYFGQHPYGEWKLFDDNPHEEKKKNVFEPATINLVTSNNQLTLEHNNVLDFSDELAVIYSDMYEYSSSVDIKSVDDGKPFDFNGNMALIAEVKLSHFPNKALLIGNLVMEFKNKGMKSVELGLNNMKSRRFVNDKGELQKVLFYFSVPASYIKMMSKVTFNTQLDIYGDQSFMVPYKNQNSVKIEHDGSAGGGKYRTHGGYRDGRDIYLNMVERIKQHEILTAEDPKS